MSYLHSPGITGVTILKPAFFKQYPGMEFVYSGSNPRIYVGRVMPNPDPATREQHLEICYLAPKEP
ncbi:hypothetical protein CHLRE_15g641674v5 [Chlamydomonas reinhardtii]|uniref:Uncharacterized protein n=1 Tax=Chlamydomonas reinhardtii TaxID=3055 RepID=A8JHI7_CHLRE|nr:uncharacterized protein CHLRE_15g641674v5 [Chlamydomonas reinhardtii]XP_042916534.1 uncharacterized protein CHLRE_15g641674v5 [Chlamydomonas reinhardtii]PNW72770.1 hypothetical protein CHLRE_15g641674v5 [Chlamydomonas reinhardtii]PNW72771.1 hypothetical protein CHLRE_15g641674v5 [Chlamydomonas reinhardtii]|eukprot:XP_001703070.1 predicted protein [Chlamydomonas reinhardtii]